MLSQNVVVGCSDDCHSQSEANINGRCTWQHREHNKTPGTYLFYFLLLEETMPRSNILDSPDYSMAANDATIVSKTCIIQFLDFGE